MENRKVLIAITFALVAIVGFAVANNNLIVGSLTTGSVLVFQ